MIPLTPEEEELDEQIDKHMKECQVPIRITQMLERREALRNAIVPKAVYCYEEEKRVNQDILAHSEG
jgi:hypothetical protein